MYLSSPWGRHPKDDSIISYHLSVSRAEMLRFVPTKKVIAYIPPFSQEIMHHSRWGRSPKYYSIIPFVDFPWRNAAFCTNKKNLAYIRASYRTNSSSRSPRRITTLRLASVVSFFFLSSHGSLCGFGGGREMSRGTSLLRTRQLDHETFFEMIRKAHNSRSKTSGSSYNVTRHVESPVKVILKGISKRVKSLSNAFSEPSRSLLN